MSAVLIEIPTPLARPLPDLRAPEGLDEVERTMLALTGADDRAGRMSREHLASGGKRLRARLALAAGAALGAAERDAVRWAAAVELLHNATLVHDDLQDGDTVRRGVPTLWSRHGAAQAINAGDFMLMLPFLAIAEAHPERQGELSRALADHAVRTVRGQMAEVELLAERTLEWRRYLDVIESKTGALLGLPVFGAAILAGRPRGQAERLSSAFQSLGVMFQLQDDVLDLYGDKGRGRVGSDLYEGKVSALVVAHLARRPDARGAVLAVLGTPRGETREADVLALIDAFRRSGALGDVLDRVHALAVQVRRCPALREEPALRRIALDLAALSLDPIRHLLAGPAHGVRPA
ncbi:MAG: polyprenyl synthetase family protein [Nannocystaceae bacterium]